jgi:hypothetical protein
MVPSRLPLRDCTRGYARGKLSLKTDDDGREKKRKGKERKEKKDETRKKKE